MELKFIDLFCGIGGFHQVLKKFNYKCILACDKDIECRKTYNQNYGIEPFGDIRDIDENAIEDFDILCAGFPCQPFSNSGKKLNFKDSRGLLFDEIIRIACKKKPKFMFLENVKHILKISNGEVFEYIKNKIVEIGYTMQYFKISPHTYGIPQNRERVYFVCIRNDIYSNTNIELSNVKCNKTFDDYIDKNNENDEKYKIKKEIEKVLDIWEIFIQNMKVGEKISPTILINDYYKNYNNEEFENLEKWRKDYMTKNKPLLYKYGVFVRKWYDEFNDILKKREIYGKLEWQTGPIKKNDSIYNYFIQIRQSGIRVKKSDYFPTLVAINQIPIYGKQKRYITPRECSKLQNFPENFKIHENDNIAYKQFGNSINIYNALNVIGSTLLHYNFIENEFFLKCLDL